MLPVIYVTISSYGLMVFLGLFISLMFLFMRSPKFDITFKEMISLTIKLFIGMAIGSKILSILVGIPEVLKDFSLKQLLILILTSGFVFYGGLIGALITLILCTRKKSNKIDIINYVTPIFPLFHGFGRIGCLLAGCCYGKEASWGVILYSEPDVVRLPIQLFESIFEFLIFFILLIYEKKCIKVHKQYQLMTVYLISYAIFRFCNEFLRGDIIRGIWFGLSTSQWISIFMLITIVLISIKSKKLNSIY